MDYIKINDSISLGEPTLDDIDNLVKYLNNKEIYNNTLSIPYPYTKQDGEWFVNFVGDKKTEFGETLNWSIREKQGNLIGGIGFQNGINKQKAKIGYWLAKPYWGKSIMKIVVGKVYDIGFNKFGLKRITATIFEHNVASAKWWKNVALY
tara:strand:- start:386 stop:835 length:450 start_codon:yes stop_codon:yes gene_type:complete